MKKFNINKGITLVALIITVIILLILAGITISQLAGNGIFEKVKQAKVKWENAQELEDETLGEYQNLIKDNYMGSVRDTTPATSENTMSTSEHFIGEYYLNGKPIYEKTIYVASFPNKNTVDYSHGIENIEFVWANVSKCYFIDPNKNSTFTLPYVHTTSIGSGYSIGHVNKSTFRINVGSTDRRTASGYVTLNYTKTTDTATIETDLPVAFPVDE